MPDCVQQQAGRQAQRCETAVHHLRRLRNSSLSVSSVEEQGPPDPPFFVSSLECLFRHWHRPMTDCTNIAQSGGLAPYPHLDVHITDILSDPENGITQG